jgi:Transglutaminase-like superfamily
MSSHVTDGLSKLLLALDVWRSFVAVQIGLRRHPLPELVRRLGSRPRRARRESPLRLSRAVTKSLSIGPYTARCLVTSLVLYRLLQEQGEAAELVIGLPSEPEREDAHAWVEISGVDVGPAPGKGKHEELARYPE